MQCTVRCVAWQQVWVCLSFGPFGPPQVDSLSTMNVTGEVWNEKGEDYRAAALINLTDLVCVVGV